MSKTTIVETFWNEKWKLLETPSPTKTALYYISNYGKIKSVNKETSDEQLLKGSTIRGGYKQLNLRLANGKRFNFYIHKFVAEHFISNKNEKRIFVIHKDGNNSNNHWKNLKWMTRKEMTKWQIAQGIYDSQNKKRASNTKLTETRVKMIKKWIREGKTKRTVIARRMGISTMQVSRIERGENWGHVVLEEAEIKNV